jgi:hypothetical protein
MKKTIIVLLIIVLMSILVACGGEKEPEELPVISDTTIDLTDNMLMGYDLVRDVYIGVEDGEVVVSIVVNPAITDEYAKEIGDSAARFLASMAVSSNENLKSPSKDHLGDLYDYYDLSIIIGSGPENVIVQGYKAKKANRILWD